MILKRSTALEWSVKNILLEGLNQFHSANLALSSDLDQDTDVWFACKISNLSMHYLLEHTRVVPVNRGLLL